MNVVASSSFVGSIVVLGNDHTPIYTHLWDEHRLDNVILKSSRVQVSFDEDELSLGMHCYSYPLHDGE